VFIFKFLKEIKANSTYTIERFPKMVLNEKKWYNRLAVALGGFLIFIGIIVIGVFLASTMGLIDLNIIETENLQGLVLGLLLMIGAVDLVAAVILWRK
jgi:cation transporter-like permease